MTLGDEKVGATYATGIVVLLSKQKGKTAKAIERLKKLHQAHSRNEEIAFTYATGLLILSSRQSPQEAKVTIDIIEGLCRKYPRNERMKEISEGILKQLREK